MAPFLFLIAVSLTVYVISYLLIRLKRLPIIANWIVLLGTSTAFLAMLVSQTMSLWYALLVILGLSFATAVLLSKQQEAKTHN
ncbi:hypothetical protein [Sporosarcina gallistercoris]|uniref:DUF2651 domain-containing protein n=1 Tax=Sporosarcina gallistercoris TaxID=2762245 RepID=A0ABR8PJS7_9BACL|nr:hypothetical protein [Sporosarcina gallistercoris]MBD7908395.1 hypothetical protein [Sporosarcina gallistercoris]